MNMNNHIKKLIYLTEHSLGKKDVSFLNEKAEAILESKKTEELAVKYLNNNGNNLDAKNLVNQFKNFDTSKNQINLVPIAAAYLLHNNIRDLESVFRPAGEMLNNGQIKPIEVSKDGFKLGDKTFPDWLKFSEYIHGLEKMGKGHKEREDKRIASAENDAEILTTGDGIKIYDGNDVGKCIKMTRGGLTGKAYSFCIGQPANSMWQSYRDSKTSTFYYIVDENRTMDDPLHIVVFDNTKYGIELTDANNTTGSISEYGSDVNGYIDYLKSKNVNVDELTNKPKTPEEEAEQERLGSENQDLDWFKNLSYEEQSKYIGRGHLLSDEQFKYLWQFRNPIKKGGYNLLNQYVSTGQAIPENQFNILVGENY